MLAHLSTYAWRCAAAAVLSLSTIGQLQPSPTMALLPSAAMNGGALCMRYRYCKALQSSDAALLAVPERIQKV